MWRFLKPFAIGLLLLSTVALIVASVWLPTNRRGSAGLPAVAARPNPLPRHEYITERSVAPEVALKARLNRVEAVARIRVLNAPRVRAIDSTERLRRRFPGLNPAHRSVHPVTEWPVRVIEALRPYGSVATGATITVGAGGGRVIFEDRELIAEDPAFDLVAGQSYLVFLLFQDQLDMFVLTEFDVFNVDGPQVRPAASRTQETPYGKQLIGQSSEDAIRIVRAAL